MERPQKGEGPISYYITNNASSRPMAGIGKRPGNPLGYHAPYKYQTLLMPLCRNRLKSLSDTREEARIIIYQEQKGVGGIREYLVPQTDE